MQEFNNYRNQILRGNQARSNIQSLNTPIASLNNMQHPQQINHGSNFTENELYKRICQEFLKMKSNYDKMQHAQMALRNTALEPSSLDNLIRASQNPMEANRQRLDSLQVFRNQQMGRKRAMTMDGPVKMKYVKLNHTK